MPPNIPKSSAGEKPSGLNDLIIWILNLPNYFNQREPVITVKDCDVNTEWYIAVLGSLNAILLSIIAGLIFVIFKQSQRYKKLAIEFDAIIKNFNLEKPKENKESSTTDLHTKDDFQILMNPDEIDESDFSPEPEISLETYTETYGGISRKKSTPERRQKTISFEPAQKDIKDKFFIGMASKIPSLRDTSSVIDITPQTPKDDDILGNFRYEKKNVQKNVLSRIPSKIPSLRDNSLVSDMMVQSPIDDGKVESFHDENRSAEKKIRSKIPSLFGCSSSVNETILQSLTPIQNRGNIESSGQDLKDNLEEANVSMKYKSPESLIHSRDIEAVNTFDEDNSAKTKTDSKNTKRDVFSKIPMKIQSLRGNNSGSGTFRPNKKDLSPKIPVFKKVPKIPPLPAYRRIHCMKVPSLETIPEEDETNISDEEF